MLDLTIFIAIILVVLLMIMAILKETIVKRRLALIIATILVCGLFLLLKYNTTEAFENSDVYNMLSLIGNQTQKDRQSSNYAKNSPTKYYNEDLTTISQGLTIYYSSFSHASYRILYNITKFFQSTANSIECDTTQDDTNAFFSQNISFSRDNGFTFGATSITGPKGYQLGISGNSSFTIFMTLNFSAFDSTNDNPYEIFKIPANTNNNNGFSFQLNNVVAEIGGLYGTSMALLYGTQSIRATDSTTNTNLIIINPAHTYFLVFVKNNIDISVMLFPNIDNVGATAQNAVHLVKNWKIDPSEEVLFSNKELLINQYQNLYGNLYNFGIYNTSLDNSKITALYIHTQTELQKNNQVIVGLASQITQLHDQVASLQACPYHDTTQGSNVCIECKSVTDWTNINNIIGANNACHTAIDQYCTAHPTNSRCECWDPNNSASATVACSNYVNIFQKKISHSTESNTSCDIDDPLILQRIKDKYNVDFCPIEISTEKQTTNSLKKKDDSYLSQFMVDDKFSINQEYIDLYNNTTTIMTGFAKMGAMLSPMSPLAKNL